MKTPGKAPRIIGGLGADGAFWDALDEGRFTISCCAGCKKWIWPAHWRCSACGSYELEWPEVEMKGTVYAWTRCHSTSDRIMERAEDLPYVVVNCELPQAGNARVIGVLKGPDEGIRVGAPVRGVIDPPSPKSKGYSSVRWVLDRGDAA